MSFRKLTAIALILFSGSLAAQTISISTSGNEVEADIDFLLGLGADLTLEFDSAFGLSASSVGISASIVNPLNIGLLSRLPSVDVSIPSAFPMLITVEPPLTGGLGFTDTVLVEIHTHHLSLLPNTPFRLFKASLGGDFEDITETIGAGSIRSRGRTGGFSQFLILADLRSHDTVGDVKFDGIEDYLDDLSLPTAVDSGLRAHLSNARTHFEAQDYTDAEDDIDLFISAVESAAGSSIPNVWRAARDLENAAGNLVGKASSLRFTLRMAESLSP